MQASGQKAGYSRHIQLCGSLHDAPWAPGERWPLWGQGVAQRTQHILTLLDCWQVEQTIGIEGHANANRRKATRNVREQKECIPFGSRVLILLGAIVYRKAEGCVQDCECLWVKPKTNYRDSYFCDERQGKVVWDNSYLTRSNNSIIRDI